MRKINFDHWLNEQDIPALSGQPDPAIGPPTVQPDASGGMPSITNPPDAGMPPSLDDDITKDPQAPDMPEEPQDTGEDFEVWKNTFFKESIKGDAVQLEYMLKQVWMRDLEEPQKKFIDDNLNIIYLRKDSNINEASTEIRKLVKEQLDLNNPSVSVVNHITSVLESYPTLNNIYIKLSGMHALKGDLHRKFVASLLGAIQVGSGSSKPHIIYEEVEYSIQMTTRYNSQFGNIDLGRWALKEDDTAEGKFLSAGELKRLHEGSPEEKEVLRKRLIIESIAEQYEERAFIINVSGDDGTVYHIGWDMSNSLRSGYQNGRLIVRTRESDNSETMINNEGEIIPLIDIDILYTKETGSVDEDGKPAMEEIQFIERRDGVLFLTADLNTLREASSALSAFVFKEVPWRGNPSDLRQLQRAFPKADEMLLRSE